MIMNSEIRIIDKICAAANAFYYALGEFPNVVYVSKVEYLRITTLCGKHIHITILPKLDITKTEISIDDRIAAISLLIKKHKNEYNYDAVESVYVCKE